jgi:DNA-binding NarL/FixJ family response regulator
MARFWTLCHFAEVATMTGIRRGAVDRQIRVLVANRPKLMREVIIETLSEEPDIAIVGEVSEEADIASQVEQTQPDVLFIALSDELERPAVCEAILRAHPSLSIIAVAEHGNRTVRYWASFSIHASTLDASGEAILSAMRRNTAFSGKAS